MDPLSFTATLNRLTMIGRYALETEIEPFLEAVDNTLGVAPFIDPTLYARGSRRLELIGGFGRALLEFKTKAKRFSVEMASEQADGAQRLLEPGGPA